MPKARTVDAVRKIVGVLEPMEKQERARVIRAALTLLGDEIPDGGGTPGGREAGSPPRSMQLREKEYFDQKNPRTKVDEIAVAARYREERDAATVHTRYDLQSVITAARRNFDAKNFRRDLENARKAGLFTRGTGRDTIILSHYGQRYADAFPDREALKQLHRPKTARRRSAGSKKKG
jgi:hypothetical protein